MTSLKDKTAVVIGGESGIGRAVCTALASAGASVRVAGILDEQGAITVDAIVASGGTAHFSHVDVRNVAQLEAAIRSPHPSDAGLDILVYCAGVFDNMAGCLETTEVLWDQLMDINLKGCFLANKFALEMMIPRRFGRIINFGSVASFTAAADGFPYTVSKHAMIGLTKHIARRYSGEGITANCVCPGSIQTDIVSNSLRILGDDLPEMRRDLFTGGGWKQWAPAGRPGRTDEVADLVMFLAGGNSGYITGQAIAIDGGWMTAG